MHASSNLLHHSVDRAARIVALDLLEAAAKQRGRLGNKRNIEALHDFRVAVRRLRSWLRAFDEWLDDSVPRKAPRRLKKAARSTNASRDADVRLVWLREQRKTINTAERPGLGWILKRISEDRADSFEADVKKGARSFDKANRQLDRSLRDYRVRIDDADEAPLFDAVLGGLIRDHTTDLSRRLGAVHTIGNAKQIHVARISAKRLRYLIDPVADLVPGVKELVDELGKLQDALGDSHDVLLFAEELDEISAEARAEDARLAPGLSALSQRLKTRAEEAFSEVKRWLDGPAIQLLERVDIIADALAPPRHPKLELVRENTTA
jgi:CHAD domain-containing protein